MSKLFIVVPCYNEEEVLPISSKVLLDFLKRMIAKNKVSTESSILFVDDGSKDKTWAIIKRLSEQEEHFKGLKFSRNFGHPKCTFSWYDDSGSICRYDCYD